MPRAKKVAPVAPIDDAAMTVETVAPSVPEMIALGRLIRAPENVRKTDKAVDIEGLADDIQAKGLLQSLIGYAGDTSIDKAAVYVSGGGRRLQALHLLRDRGAVDDDFPVPVLIRAQADAVDLSLSENLGKRDMNPADEFEAFAHLMRPGTLSPADLAKRFGFSERYVKQRLRLADLAPEILHAMRGGKLTIDAAMAYAESQDHKLQLRVFAVEAKKSYEPHKAWNIRYAYQSAQMTTSDPLFKLAGAKRYEEQGGRYEDDLFTDAERYGNRKVIDSAIVLSIARAVADFQKKRLLSLAQKIASTTSDLLIPPAIRRGALPKAPKGFKLVDRGYRYNLPSYADLRKAAAEQGIDVVAIASVGQDGEFSIEDRFFVPANRLDDVIPPQGEGPPQKSEEEYAAERRADAIERCRLFLAADKINAAMKTGAVEGRRFWKSNRPYPGKPEAYDGIGEAYCVAQTIVVTVDEVDAIPFEAAEAEYERQEAAIVAQREAKERAEAAAAEARGARAAELIALDPAPEVIAVKDLMLFRWESGEYCDERESTDADPVYVFDDPQEIVEWVAKEGCAITAWWMTLADHDAAAAQADVDHVGYVDDAVDEAA